MKQQTLDIQSNRRPITVQEYIEQFNEEFRYREIAIIGELQEVRTSKNAWAFFQLKDEDNESVLRCFAVLARIGKIKLEDGMKVIVKGYAKLHEKYGFSVTVEHIELHGEGTLQKALKELQEKLEQEGIFEESRKREIPEVPSSIALIASEESAAYSDFIKVINERRGGLNVDLYHTGVQGAEAIPGIVQAIERVSKHGQQYDTLVITRGGGSIEDLQAFNAEEVVRALYRCKVPSICAIGHERDVTLAEYAADKRASTPSNAAELVSKTAGEVIQQQQQYLQTIEFNVMRKIQDYTQTIQGAGMKFQHALTKQQQRIIALEQHLQNVGQQLKRGIRQEKEELSRSLGSMEKMLQYTLQKKQQQLEQYRHILQLVSPEETLQRGYTITKDDKGNILTSIQQVKQHQSLKIQFKDGIISTVRK